MEDFGDSREALFEEPNAYLQKYECTCLNCKEKKPRQKIIFQEPYECMPNFHINNDFKSSPNHNKFSKDNCSCDKGNCNCGKGNNASGNRDNDNRPMFDLKNLMPLLSSLTGGNGGGLNNIIKMLGGSAGDGGGLNNILKMLGGNGENELTNILSNLTKSGGLGSILNGLNISNLFNKKQSQKPEMKSTEFCIKDYTRVE